MDLMPSVHDLYGWSAAGLTLLAFSCSNIIRLRYVAITANAAFIAYGLTAQLWPVLVLHAVLVPINLWRLRQALHSSAPFSEAVPRLPSTPIAAESEGHA